MTHKLIKTDNYLLVGSNDDLRRGWFYCVRKNDIFQDEGEDVHCCNGDIRITAHLPLNNSPILEGVPLLPPLEDEVEKLAKKHLDSLHNNEDIAHPEMYDAYISFELGYNTAKEKYKYTEEDILIIRNKLASMLPKGDISAWDMIVAASKYTIWFDNYIQHLQQPKMPVGFESEDEVYMYSINGDTMKPKTTTNSQGQTVLVGTYK
jgi:hypothetical protein